MFAQLVEQMFKLSKVDFWVAIDELANYIDTADDFVGIMEEIGTIPEAIEHDSSVEKLFAKASDAVLARAFREIGLKSTLLKARGNSADVQAQSPVFGYTMVADAKTFRMSRTAKNQKDFKVAALSGWRKDADYAVVCSPYFQYPKSQSQIYAQSIEYNVCLLCWEDLLFMIKHGIKESAELDLSPIWGYGGHLAHTVVVADKERCFLADYGRYFLSLLGATEKEYFMLLNKQADIIKRRGLNEKMFWEKERTAILTYSKNKAIQELLKSKKIDNKIRQIEHFIGGLKRA